MPPDIRAIAGVDDSKRLSRGGANASDLPSRFESARSAWGLARRWSARSTESTSIRRPSLPCGARCRRLGLAPHHVLIDGKPFRTLEIAHTAIVGGDDLCYTIACASIIAKVTRDRIMYALAGHYPNYRWDRNVGYAYHGTHRGVCASHGVTPPIHRRGSFIPVRQLSLDFGASSMSAVDIGAPSPPCSRSMASRARTPSKRSATVFRRLGSLETTLR